MDIPRRGSAGATSSQQYSVATNRPRPTRRWPGQSTLAECLLSDAGLLQLASGLCVGDSTPSWVRPSTGKPDAGNPPVRFGGRGNLAILPTPIKVAPVI